MKASMLVMVTLIEESSDAISLERKRRRRKGRAHFSA